MSGPHSEMKQEIEVSLSQLIEHLSAEVITVRGDLPSEVTITSPISRVNDHAHSPLYCVVFCLEGRYLSSLGDLAASPLVIVTYDRWREEAVRRASSEHPLSLLLISERSSASEVIAETLRWLDKERQSSHIEASHSEKSGQIHPTAQIGSFCVIEERVIIEAEAELAPYCYLGRGVHIGARAKLDPRVTIFDRCSIASAAHIYTGAVIGSQGFGIDERGQIPHLGAVSIGRGARIGALNCIDRASLGVTEVGDNAQLDNLVQVGHNAKIGRGSVICAQSGLAGRAQLGSQVTLGGQTGVTQGAYIAGGSRVAAKSGVTKSLMTSGEYSGYPAEPNRPRLRREARLRRGAEKRSTSRESASLPISSQQKGQIHPTASVHPTAVIGDRSEIGAGCIIHPYAVIGDDVMLGERCSVSSFAVIGSVPQVRASDRLEEVARPPLKLHIGPDNQFFRESPSLCPPNLFRGERARFTLERRTSLWPIAISGMIRWLGTGVYSPIE